MSVNSIKNITTPLVIPGNVTTKFRDAFETFNTGSWWNLVQTGSGDVVQVDGNAIAASYLVISKSPLSTGSTLIIESQDTFVMPTEIAMGLHMSQRTWGQEFSVEFVSTDTPLPFTPDIAIAGVTQSGTTITVNTVTPHGLVPGKRFGIVGTTASLNYPALVVASIPSASQFTATAGPNGTIPSLTLSTGQSGSVYFRPALYYAQDGTSMIFENTAATNASIYVRAQSGDALPTGTAIGNHSVTIATTATNQAINAAYTYAFLPTTEFRLSAQTDRINWYDVAVDSTGQSTSRLLRTQVCPSPTKTYKLRFRAENNKSLTVPNAQIVSASKTGTTTSTVRTNVPHNLLVGDPVVIYGGRDTNNFANVTTATPVLSVIDSNTFTVVWGAAASATTYGGYVAEVMGGNLMSALGALTQVVQSAQLSSGTLTLIGSATWSGFSIGDYVELVGVRNSTNGDSLNVDGGWKVSFFTGTVLVLTPLSTTTVPVDFGVTNCGGALIRRTDLRISYVRIFEYEYQRIEALTRGSGEQANSLPVNVQNTVPGVSTVTTLTNQTQFGGIIAVDQIPSFMHMAADNLRRNISVT